MKKQIGRLGFTLISFLVFMFMVTMQFDNMRLKNELNAASSPEYYKPNEIFHHTGKSTFLMGGLSWRILYTDQNAQGYIIADNIVNSTNCDSDQLQFENTCVLSTGISTCLTKAQASYLTGSNDVVGEMIQKLNPNSLETLKIATLDEYKEITDNEANAEIFTTPSSGGAQNYIWLDLIDENNRLIFVDIRNKPLNPYQEYKHIGIESVTQSTTSSKLNPMFKISLPQSNQLAGISYKPSKPIYNYGDEDVIQGGVVGELKALKGEGSYSAEILSGFTMTGDKDEQGNEVASGKILSSDFELKNFDAVNGSAQLSANKKVLSGEHYVKIKMKDHSTNSKLYIDENDPLRTKTIVVKITVGKANQEELKFYEDSEKTKEVSSITKTSFDKSFPFYLYTGGGSNELSDASVKYVIKSGNDIISSIEPSGGSSKVVLSGKSGTAVISVTKKGNNNFNDITKEIAIEVVPALAISYTPKYGSSMEDVYTYKNNVGVGNTVGVVNYSNGTDPISYELVADPNKVNDYKNFSLSKSSATGKESVDVIINENGPNINEDSQSLEAGEYNFIVEALDAKGKPVDANNKKLARQEVSITVEKCEAKISFDVDDKGTTYVSGSTSEVSEHSEHATHANEDVAQVDEQIEYSLKSGNSAMVTGLPFTSTTTNRNLNLRFKENQAGTIVIQAQLPSTKNYKEAITSKTIEVQLGIVGNYIEDQFQIKAGTNAAKPPVSYIQASRIAHLNIAGGVAPFSYALPVGKGNNASFHIDSSGNLYVDQAVGENGLAPGSYDIEILVSDSTVPILQTTTIKKTIEIGAASLSGVGFEDPKNPGTIILGDKIEYTYDPSSSGGSFHTSLLESQKGALSNTSISFSTEPNPNNIVSVQGSGTGTANSALVSILQASDVATMDTIALKANVTGGIYGSEGVSERILINILKYPQTISFDKKTKLSLPNNADCVKMKVVKTSEHCNESEANKIIYSSTSKAFTIDNDKGEICPIKGAKTSSAGDTLTATIRGDANFTAHSDTRQIEIYSPGNIEVSGSIAAVVDKEDNISYQEKTRLEALNNSTLNPKGTAKASTTMHPTIVANVKLKDVEAANNAYKISANTGVDNADAALFTILGNGNMTLNEDISAIDIMNHGNIYKVQVEVSDIYGYSQVVNLHVFIEDAQPDFYFTDALNQPLPTSGNGSGLYYDGVTGVAKYTTTYMEKGSFNVYTNTNNATFMVDTSDPSKEAIDVLSQSDSLLGSSQFNVDHASDKSTKPMKNAYITSCREKGNGFKAACIFAQVDVEAANRNLAFVANPFIMGKDANNVVPLYKGHTEGGEVLIQSSSNPSIVLADPYIAGNGNQSISAGSLAKPGQSAILTAYEPASRDYKADTAETTVEISDKQPTTLILSVSPMASLVYGENNASVNIVDGYNQALPAIYWSDDDSILEVVDEDIHDQTSGTLSIHHVGNTIINVCQTSDPNWSAPDTCPSDGDYGYIQVSIRKRPIQLQLEDKERYTGESLPNYTLVETPISGSFVGTDSIHDFPLPQNTRAMQDSTTLVDTSKPGIYPIQASYSSEEAGRDIIDNYEVIFQDGKFNVKQDESLRSWYTFKGTLGDQVLNLDNWQNQEVNISLENAIGSAGNYEQLSKDLVLWDSSLVHNIEGEQVLSLSSRIDPSNELHPGAISSSQNVTIKIDKTPPKIDKIAGTNINEQKVAKVIHALSFGIFLKPGVEIEVKCSDPIKNGIKVSGVKEVSYKVYSLDKETGTFETVPMKEGIVSTNGDGVAKLPALTSGTYQVCAISNDHAGNPSSQSCAEINVKKIGVDVDGDKELDFNDPDEDGCADTDIKWENEQGEWIKLNLDRDGNGVPDLDIDSDGDGIADINVDSDQDGLPDINLIELSKSTWLPKDRVSNQSEEYCTMNDIVPIINLVPDEKKPVKDRIPYLNIDIDGDMKEDINIDTGGDKKADLNILHHTTWNPSNDFPRTGFHYDSEVLIPVYNIDSNNDGYADINVDIDNDGIADINIDTDGDLSKPETNIDTDGDGIPDINLDPDGDGIITGNKVVIEAWIPEKLVEGEYLTYGTMDLKYEGKDKLEDNGVIVKPSDPNIPFLPNHALKVDDITDQTGSDVKDEILKNANSDNGEVKKVYDVKVLEDNKEVQPDGSVEISIPVDDAIKNPKVLMKTKEGKWELMDGTIVDGMFIFQTDYVGDVSVVGDKVEAPIPEPKPEPEQPEPKPEPTPETPSIPKPPVKGNYVNNSGIGGAMTGDAMNVAFYIMLMGMAYSVLFQLHKKK